MVGLAKLTESVYGQNQWVVGLQVVPTNPQGQSVQVSTGQMYQVDETDMSGWSSLPGDPTEIVQQGFLNNVITFTINPPPLPSESQWYLIEGQFEQLDTNTAILQFFNPVSPATPFNGPGNSGSASNQDRLGTVLLRLKPGLPAPTGDEVKPTIDSGFLALAYVHINFGQATLGNGDITDVRPTYPTIPQILAGGLKQFGITPGLGGNLDASTLNGHPASDFVLTSNQNLTGVARLVGGDTITGLDTFTAGISANHYEYQQLTADPGGFPNGSTWFNATDFHLRAQLGNRVRRILTEADMGAGGIIDASTLDGMTAAQIIGAGGLNFSSQTITVSQGGSNVLLFPFPVTQAIVFMQGVTLPAGGGNASAVVTGMSNNQVTVAISLTAGANATFTVLAFS